MMTGTVQPTQRLSGGGWQKDRAHFPEPITPFGGSIYVREIRHAVAQMCEQFGLMIQGLDTEVVGGEIYIRPKPVFGPAEAKGPPPPAWLLGLLARVVPALRRRNRQAQQALDAGLLETLPGRWADEWRDELSSAFEQLLAVELSGLDDAALVAHGDQCLALIRRGQEIHFELFLPYVVPLHELYLVCEELLGWELSQVVPLLSGYSPASVAGHSELRSLAAAIAENEQALATLRASPGDPVAALRSVDGDLAADLERWISRHGWRTANYDAGSPTLIERPGLVTELLLVADRSGPDGTALAITELSARSRLSGAPLERFEAALALARERYPLREENVILTDNMPNGLMRRWLLEAAERLVGAGILAQRDDAAFLEHDEVRAALSGGSQDRWAATAAERQHEWAWTRLHPGPDQVGKPGTPPDVSRLPAAARRLNGALLWMMGLEYPQTPESPGEALAGVAASPGQYTGPIRVIRGEADFEKLRPGDVLVCAVTTPAWSPLFTLAGALVTDGGGLLSHPAIVAREYGLPAVLGTRHATSVLTDGELVAVDGSAGTVTRVSG